MQHADLNQVLSNLHRLPAIPAVVLELISELGNDELQTEHLAQKIGQDPVLAARLLQIANSPFYGLSRKIGSLNEAIIILGLSSVRTLMVAVGVIQGWSGLTAGLFDSGDYWRTNFRVAQMARYLAFQTDQNPDMGFTAGLLHDIGQLVLVNEKPEIYLAMLGAALDGDDLVAHERAAFGFDHAELGEALAMRWNFPLEIQQAIAWHHQIDLAVRQPLAMVVCLADWLENRLEQHEAAEDIVTGLPVALYERFPSDLIESALDIAGGVDKELTWLL